MMKSAANLVVPESLVSHVGPNLSNWVFSGWNWFAKNGYFLCSTIATNLVPSLAIEVAVIMQF